MSQVRYRVILERDETGAWIARVKNIRGCHSYGRTLDQARSRIREALALWVDDAETAQLVEEIRLPARALRAVQKSRDARHDAEVGRKKARTATVDAARTLVDDLELGLRDAGDLLGISHQRVQQLLTKQRRRT